jgi:hypothetical protein
MATIPDHVVRRRVACIPSVLFNFEYNLGVETLERSTLLRLLNAGQYAGGPLLSSNSGTTRMVWWYQDC